MIPRRNFLRLVGGGTVVAAAAASAAAWKLSPAYPSEAVAIWDGPGAEPDSRKRALAFAVTAPNPHNRQPWLADLQTPGQITLYCDRQRLLPETDPFGRQILIGHGAFLELLVMALAQQGIRADVALWPEGELARELAGWEHKPVARLRLASGGVPDPLFDQVLRRHTAKVRYDTTRPVPVEQLSRLVGAVPTDSGLIADGTLDAERLPALRKLCLDAAKVEMDTERTAMESVRLMRVGPDEILRHRDGISINSPIPRVMAALGQFDRSAAPTAGSPGYDQAFKMFEDHSLSAMGFVWLATAHNTRSDQIAAGRAYVRQQLLATQLGIGMHPMSQALQEFVEMTPHREAAHQMLLGSAAPQSVKAPTLQMFCRIGYPVKEVPATPRRALGGFVLA